MELSLRPASQPFYELSFCLAMRVAAVLQASKTVPARRAFAQSWFRAMNRSPKSDVGGVSGVRITGSDHRDEFATKTTTN